MVETAETQLDLIFGALSDRTRRTILLMLLESDHTISDLADPFDMSMAAISKHVQLLVSAGLITQERRGREKWCRLNTDGLNPASFWLESYSSVIDDSFTTLAAVLKAQDILDETD